jgi:hypothetical protein
MFAAVKWAKRKYGLASRARGLQASAAQSHFSSTGTQTGNFLARYSLRWFNNSNHSPIFKIPSSSSRWTGYDINSEGNQVKNAHITIKLTAHTAHMRWDMTCISLSRSLWETQNGSLKSTIWSRQPQNSYRLFTNINACQIGENHVKSITKRTEWRKKIYFRQSLFVSLILHTYISNQSS